MSWWNPLSWGDESDSTRTKRLDMNRQGEESSAFADDAQTAFINQRGALDGTRQNLQNTIDGKNLLSGEMLRQGLQQNLAQQRSIAAGAAPRDASMAARTAAIQSGRLGYGMSGQATMAGLQEKKDAQAQLAELLMRQRQQELEASLGARQNAISGYGGVQTEASGLEKAAPLINAGVGLVGARLGRK
jgi:hypothetical protein